jgi:hypothetical protein
MTLASSWLLLLQADRGELIVDRGELGPDRGELAADRGEFGLDRWGLESLRLQQRGPRASGSAGQSLAEARPCFYEHVRVFTRTLAIALRWRHRTSP